MGLVELLDVGVDGLDVLAQPLPLGQEAARGVERPDDQGRPLLQVADDLGGDPVDGALDAADGLGAVAADRDGLAQQVAVGTTTSVARRTSSLASSGASARFESSGAAETGTPPAVLGAEVIVVDRFGANEPAAGISAGRSADWSRSWNVESDASRLSDHLRAELPLRFPVHLVPGERQARQEQPVHQQAQGQRGQLDVEPAARTTAPTRETATPAPAASRPPRSQAPVVETRLRCPTPARTDGRLAIRRSLPNLFSTALNPLRDGAWGD